MQENTLSHVRAAATSACTFHTAMWLTAVMSVVAMLLMLTGPSLSHHYAELSPYHSHVILSDGSSDGHAHNSADHHDEAGDSRVVSVSENNAAGSGLVQFVVSPGTHVTPRLITNSVIYEAEPTGADGFIGPPERPPRLT